MKELKWQSVRSRLNNGDSLFGTFVSSPDPMVFELLGSAGMDFLVSDAEHGIFDRAEVLHIVSATDNAGAACLFRVPGVDPVWISTVLDAGAAGVIVPRIDTADQARAVVQAGRYPPHGRRGVAPGRAQGYGYGIADYLKRADEDILLAIQIETTDGLANLEEIVTVDGIDAVLIGPNDLAVSLGLHGSRRHELEPEIERIVVACRARGRPVGMFLADASAIPGALQRGMTFNLVAGDMMLMMEAANALAGAVRTAKLEAHK